MSKLSARVGRRKCLPNTRLPSRPNHSRMAPSGQTQLQNDFFDAIVSTSVETRSATLSSVSAHAYDL